MALDPEVLYPNNGARTLSRLRELHGLTIEQLSQQIAERLRERIPVSMLCKYETARNKPRKRRREVLALFPGVPPIAWEEP